MNTKPQSHSEPLVSVVVPLYNHARHVVSCLDSIAADAYARLELVLIDDGSTDDGYDRALAWIEDQGKRFENIVTRRQANAGIPVTLNRLVQSSSGEFIFPIASDDEVSGRGIAGLVQFYREHCTAPALLFSDVEVIDENGNAHPADVLAEYRRDRRRLSRSRRLLRFEIVTRWGPPFAMQFYPRSLYDDFGGYDESLAFEDLYFALKAAASGRLAFAPFVTRRYRFRPGQVVTPGLEKSGFSMTPSREKVLPEFKLPYRVLIRLMNLRSGRRGALATRLVRKSLSLLRLGIR